MAKLKTCFESLGYKNVITYINSGNVIFETEKDDLISSIEQKIEKTFGFHVRVVTRTKKDIENICDRVPKVWVNDSKEKTDVIFLWDEYKSKSSLNLIETNPKVDTLKYIDGAIVWHLKKDDYNKSGMNTFIGTPIYKNMTARNINTVRKIAALME